MSFVYTVIGNYGDEVPSFVCGIFKTHSEAEEAKTKIVQHLKAGDSLIGPLNMYGPPSYYIKKIKLGTIGDIHYGLE